MAEKMVAPHDEWITKLDLKAFGEDVRALGKKLKAGQGEADAAHLNKILLWNKIFTVLGLGTMWLSPNFFTVFCLSTALYSRWAMISHHVCHGGYDNVDKASKSGFNRWVYAVGTVYRRVVDWLDVLLPEAWNIEHGRLHHYSLNEANDPDLVEMNTAFLRQLDQPRIVKLAVALFFALTWKNTYYSSNTYKEKLFSDRMKEATTLAEQMKALGPDAAKDAENAKEALMTEKKQRRVVTLFTMLDGSAPSWWTTQGYLTEVIFPYLFVRFVCFPLPFLALFGKTAYTNALINLVLADLLTNLHSFITIVTNHAGEDMYWFEDHCRENSDEFFLRQVIGSANFTNASDMGGGVIGDAVDFMSGYLNMQVEHHAWPSLSMLSYQRAAPQMEALCHKHGVPYVKENVFVRLYRTLQIFTGDRSMRKFDASLLKERS